jgi:hypothetical protein
MTAPKRMQPLENRRENTPQMTEPRADGPTRTNRPNRRPTHGCNGAKAAPTRRAELNFRPG